MLLSLQRGGRLLPHPPRRMCMRCCIRMQHSATVESPRWSPEEDDPPLSTSVNRDRQRRHPPRPPRTYVARRGRDVELKSFGFMNQVGPRPGFTERAQTDRPSDVRSPERTRRQPLNPELQKDSKQVAEVFLIASKL